MDIAGKIAVVTGASSGIGWVTALTLARGGATVVVTARREDRLQALVEECQLASPKSCHISGDISDRSFAESLISRTVEKFGRIDILVNNAGAPMHRPIYDISADDAEALMRTNFMSCLWTTFAAIPHMLLQGEISTDGGTIVNVSSFAATVTPTYETVYAASKGAMNGFTRGLWNDLAGSNIHCALVIPGPIETDIWELVEDEGAYSGKKYPAQLVANEILQSIVKRRFEVTVPRRNLQLVSARMFATFLPALIRKGVARLNPVSSVYLQEAIARARRGLPMGRER